MTWWSMRCWEFGSAYVRRLTSTGSDTQTRYLKQLASLVEWLRTIKGVEPTIENVTGDDDRDWIVSRRKAGMSPKTIANYHGFLSALFKSAVGKGLITRNPCEGVKLPPLGDGTFGRTDLRAALRAVLGRPAQARLLQGGWRGPRRGGRQVGYQRGHGRHVDDASTVVTRQS